MYSRKKGDEKRKCNKGCNINGENVKNAEQKMVNKNVTMVVTYFATEVTKTVAFSDEKMYNWDMCRWRTASSKLFPVYPSDYFTRHKNRLQTRGRVLPR